MEVKLSSVCIPNLIMREQMSLLYSINKEYIIDLYFLRLNKNIFHHLLKIPISRVTDYFGIITCLYI